MFLFNISVNRNQTPKMYFLIGFAKDIKRSLSRIIQYTVYTALGSIGYFLDIKTSSMSSRVNSLVFNNNK